MRGYRELILFGMLFFTAVLACFAFSYWQVTVSQRDWCDALNTLTSVPVASPPPRADPSRMQTFKLYEDFVKLKGEFECG